MKRAPQGSFVPPSSSADQPTPTGSAGVLGPPAPRSPHGLRDALSQLQQCTPDTDRQQVDAFLDRIVDALDERIADTAHLFAEADLAVHEPRRRWFGLSVGTGFSLITLLGGFLTSIAVAGEVFRLTLVWAAVATVNLIWAYRVGRRRAPQGRL